MTLTDLLNYNTITIQCHDSPDADALASGYAVWKYLSANGKNVSFIYGGQKEISKPNLLIMIKLLDIPIKYCTDLEKPDLLVTVDCQYGERNVQRFDSETICVIDHHEIRNHEKLPKLSRVMENYGSCSTVVYQMLDEAEFDLHSEAKLMTALYYGLYMDTCRFQELWHPIDKDMWDDLEPDEGILTILKNTNISRENLKAIGNGFLSSVIDPKYRFGTIHVNTEDQNILGIVSDTVLEVDDVDCCVAYTRIGSAIQISVRSCVKEIRADELAQAVVEGIGGAGGHIRKAGGKAFLDKIKGNQIQEKNWKDLWEIILHKRLREYFDNTETVYASDERSEDTLTAAGFQVYRKLPITAGVCDLSEYFDAGETVMLRTMEGDIDLKVFDTHLLMIGVSQEAYPIQKTQFLKDYRLTGKEFVFSGDYVPTIKTSHGKKLNLAGVTKECVGLGSALVYAKRLKKRTHVFSLWDQNKYIVGNKGDWIAVRKANMNDAYIIAKDIFEKTYQEEK